MPVEKAPFHHLEELMLHSFDARVVALFLVKLQEIIHLDPEQVAVAVKTLRLVQMWWMRSVQLHLVGISSRRPTRSDRLISPPKKGSPSAQVEQLGTSLDVNAEDAPDPVCDVDVEFLTHVRFSRQLRRIKC